MIHAPSIPHPSPRADWLAARARLTPGKTALVDTLCGRRAVSYGEWNANANRTARFFLHSFDINPGDRVAVLAKNRIEYLDVWFALGKIGGILQNLNWRLSERELAGLIADAQPSVLVYDATCADLADSLTRDSKLQTVAFDDPFPGSRRFNERDSLFGENISVELSPEAPWVICYTGGSTGLPKGALLSHRAIFSNALNTVFSWGINADDVALLNAPLFHTGGLNVLTAPLVCAGGTTVVTGGFDVNETFDAVESGGVTVFFGVPTMFIEMQRHPRWATADFSRVRFVISGGAPCPQPVFEAFWEKGVEFKTGYGLTEAGPNTFWLPADQVREKPGAVGFPLWSVEVKTARPDGSECASDETGELRIRGPHVFSGYWNNPDATAAAFDNAGWLKTGDLAARDADGCYRILGRLKEMFISGGENVFPSEIESVLHEFEPVAEAAVIGVPDAKWGEVGAAFVALKHEAGATSAEILTFCKTRLAGYKIPKTVTLLPALPKTGANKIDKLALRRLIEE